MRAAPENVVTSYEHIQLITAKITVSYCSVDTVGFFLTVSLQ